jgi:hypothetical protein
MQATRRQSVAALSRPSWIAGSILLLFLAGLAAPGQEKTVPPAPATRPGEEYSGMYTFLRDGEFVQVTVEDAGMVTGFVSRYGDLESDKDAFLNHFFKTGKLEGNKLTFTTQVVHGTSFAFAGTIERGEGKKPGDEAYYIIPGKLTETSTDAANKTSSKSRDVIFKAFPRDVGAEAGPKN